MANAALQVGDILDQLAQASRRPRYAFMVLNLLAEQANREGKAGPFVMVHGNLLPLRDWIGMRMAIMSGRTKSRRQALERRVREELKDRLPEDLFHAADMIDAAIDDRIRTAGADNFSRVLSELEHCGFVRRFYQGRFTNHENRGGLRNLACVIDREALAALRGRSGLI